MNESIGTAIGKIIEGFSVSDIIVLGIVLVAGAAWLVQKLKIKKLGPVEFGSEAAPESVQDDSSPHARCIHGKDIVKLLADQKAADQKCIRIDRRILRDQIAYMKTRLPAIKSLAQSSFLTHLAEVTGEKNGVVDHPDFLRYQVCLIFMVNEAKDIFEAAFEENHLSTRTESEFRGYVDAKIGEILAWSTDYLNNAYRGEAVGREHLYDRNQKIVERIRTIGEEIFYHARDLARDGATEIRDVEQAFARELEEVLN